MKISKAVIPAAGLGTRVLPATKVMPKEMLPIVDKPAIQYIVEEAAKKEIVRRYYQEMTNYKLGTVDIDVPERFGIVIGNEGRGISDNVRDLCDKFIYIDMNNDCESLNASVAASILMYEVNSKWNMFLLVK